MCVCLASVFACVHFLCAKHVHWQKCIMHINRFGCVHERNNWYIIAVIIAMKELVLNTIHELYTHTPAHTPLMLIAGIRCILCVACKCVCHYCTSENLQLHQNNMLRFSQSQAFVQIESSASECVWRERDKETVGCFAAIFRGTPIWRITAVDVGGNILLETYCCALNLAAAVHSLEG